MATEGKKLEEIRAEIDAKCGTFRYNRMDITVPEENKKKLFKKLRTNPPQRLDDKNVVSVKTFDGVKMILEDDSWLMLRASGTEPKVRIYSEAKSFEDVDRLLKIGNVIAQEV
jgi:phosphomannomutase